VIEIKAGIKLMEQKKKRPVGKPLKHTPDDVRTRIDAYFSRQDEQQRPYTVTGLAHAIGMDREQLINYGNKEEFADAIKEAKRKVHEFAEERLFSGNATGVIFNLKNNWGWKDKTEQEIKHSVNVEEVDNDHLVSIINGAK